jgi:hypothetical protein
LMARIGRRSPCTMRSWCWPAPTDSTAGPG